MNEESDLNRYELWAVWTSRCWRCGEDVKVALNTAGWDFNPFSDYGEMWVKTADSNEDLLRSFGVKRELRYSKTINDTYMANVCPHCGILQGDWFVQEEFLDVMYAPRGDFRLILIRDGRVADFLPTIDEFETKYWKFFLYRILRGLERCEACGCYISGYPEMFEEYRKYPEGRAILEGYGEIRELVEHHVSYKENRTIKICPACHAKIHHTNDPKYDRFRPKD
jgi:hypothetical protein